MRSLLVGYDRKEPGQKYQELSDEIKSSKGWWHHLDSTWIVRTQETPVELRDRLNVHLDSNDKLLVLDVTGDDIAWTGLSQRGSKVAQGQILSTRRETWASSAQSQS